MVVSLSRLFFTAFDPHQPAQYVQQWTASVEKSLDKETTIEVGYQGDRGLHLQRAHLINNALPGPGLIQPRRPFKSITFLPGTVFPAADTGLSSGGILPGSACWQTIRTRRTSATRPISARRCSKRPCRRITTTSMPRRARPATSAIASC